MCEGGSLVGKLWAAITACRFVNRTINTCSTNHRKLIQKYCNNKPYLHTFDGRRRNTTKSKHCCRKTLKNKRHQRWLHRTYRKRSTDKYRKSSTRKTRGVETTTTYLPQCPWIQQIYVLLMEVIINVNNQPRLPGSSPTCRCNLGFYFKFNTLREHIWIGLFSLNWITL